MTINRWHWLLATELILAAGVVGDAAAQGPTSAPVQVLPPPQEVAAPAPLQPACATRRAPLVNLWNRGRSRLERWFVSEGPDVTPLGQSLYQSMTTQIDNGIAARMILNDFDFEPCSPNLNRRGRDKLVHLASLAMRYPYRITVETTHYDPGLANRRVQMARKDLASLNIPLPADRIVEGGALSAGLSGVEAWILYQNLLNRTQSQTDSNTTAGSSGTTGGTTGAQGGTQSGGAGSTPGNR